MPGGERLSRSKEAAIAALLTQPTIAEAAKSIGVGERTLRGWLKLPAFVASYRQSRRELVEGAIGRVQAAAGQAVDTLLAIAQSGAKDSDRVRAAMGLLHHAIGGVEFADLVDSVEDVERRLADLDPSRGQERLTGLEACILAALGGYALPAEATADERQAAQRIARAARNAKGGHSCAG